MKISFTLDVKNAGDIGAFVQQGRILGNDEREEDPREEQQQKKRTEAAAADAKHVKVNVKANHSGGDKGKAPAATSSKKEIGVRNLFFLSSLCLLFFIHHLLTFFSFFFFFSFLNFFGVQAEASKALAALDKVKHLGTTKLLADVATLTRRQMRSFLMSLGCKKVSWKCDVLRKQCKAVIEARARGEEDLQDLRTIADDAHFTPRQERIQTINKIQKSFQDSQREQKSKNETHGAAATAAAADALESRSHLQFLGESADPRKKVIADMRGTATRDQMRSLLSNVGVEKLTWQSEVLRKQLEAVLDAKHEGAENLVKVAENAAISIRSGSSSAAALSTSPRSSQDEAINRIQRLLRKEHKGGEGSNAEISQLVMEESLQSAGKEGAGDGTDMGKRKRELGDLFSLIKTATEASKSKLDAKGGNSVIQAYLRPQTKGVVDTAEAERKHDDTMEKVTSPEGLSPPRHSSVSKYHGVTYLSHSNKYEAHLWEWYNAKGQRKGRQVYLGQYETAKEAAAMYDMAVLSHFRDELKELILLKDPRNKKPIGEILQLNHPFEVYEDNVQGMLEIGKDEYIKKIVTKAVTPQNLLVKD